MKPSVEYQNALNYSRSVTEEYNKVRDLYRAGKVSDEKYLAAREKLDKAEEYFDMAYEAEQMRGISED